MLLNIVKFTFFYEIFFHVEPIMLNGAPQNSNKVDKVTDYQNNCEDHLKLYQLGGTGHSLWPVVSLVAQINNNTHHRNYEIRDQNVSVHTFQSLPDKTHPIFRQLWLKHVRSQSIKRDFNSEARQKNGH